MKQYLRNLWLALTGGDPFADEVADLKERLERAGDNVRGLNEMYYSACEKWDESQRTLNECRKMVVERNSLLAERDKQIASMQRLVENLRERGKEKDARLAEQGREFRDRMEQMKADYQQRIKEYNDRLESMTKSVKQQ